MIANSQNGALVSPPWLQEHLDDPGVRLVHIDSNETESYDRGHIPGAVGWNWKEWLWDPYIRDFPTPEEFARRCAEWGISNHTTVVIYGEPLQYGTYAWWVFKYMGHPDVRLLDGSWIRWKAEGRALVTDRPTIIPATYDPPKRRNDPMRARREQLLAEIEAYRSGEKTVLLDHRSPQEFNAQRVNAPDRDDHGAERYGRIPGARHLYFEDFLNSDGTFKPKDELRRLLEQRGATPDKNIVSYCRLSHRATLAYFVMTQLLGYENVKSYDGSWTEWGSMVGMPIER
jgi:thiosulfate/3-mercaptopyruvate sulfurtransferase